MTLSSDALGCIREALGRHLADPSPSGASADASVSSIPADQLAQLDSVLSDSRVSYRDGIIIQLAYGLVAGGPLDLTHRHEGARGVAEALGTYLSENHVRSVKDAYQNIAKNSTNLARGNFPSFDAFLAWAGGASREELSACFEYACARVAGTARPVLPMPVIDKSRLTFAATARLFSRLLSTPSQGAFQQFAFAALLHATVAEHGIGGHRVETKSLNASDRSSFVAGDVQVVTGNRVVEAFEVTANSWRTKLAGIGKTIRDNDLARLHIVSALPEAERQEALDHLLAMPEDVSTLDVGRTVDALVAGLTKPGRAEALGRLYEYLDRYQPDVGRVNAYVELLRDLGLVEGGA